MDNFNLKRMLELIGLQKQTENQSTTQPTGLLSSNETLVGAGLLAQGAAGKGLFEAALPSLTQAAQIRKLIQPKDTSTTLMKNLQAAGLVPGTPEYKEAILAGTSKTEKGFQNISPLYTKGKIDNATQSATYAMSGLEKLIGVAKLTNLSPEVFGLKGKVGQVSKDIVSELKGIVSNDTQIFKKMGAPLDYFQNPDFTTIQPLENSIAIHIARNRNSEGRLLKDMIDTAKADAKLTGLGGVQKVKEKILPLANEFIDSAVQQLRLAGKNEQEIKSIINPKIKELRQYMFVENITKKTSNAEQKRFRMNTKTGKLEEY